jgi:hypothetical protein
MMHVLVGHHRMAEQQLLGHGVSSLVGDPRVHIHQFQRSPAAPRSCPADPTTGAYGG